MTRMHDTVKNIIRIEKETYDIYRLLDESKLNDKTRIILKQCAMEASRNLQLLEKKYWDLEPSIATFLQHFIPEIEFELENCDECALLDNLIKNRKSLCTLYSDLSKMDDDPESCGMFREMAERSEPFSGP